MLEGWIRFFQPSRERKYEYLAEFDALLTDSGAEAKVQAFAATFQKQLLAIRKEEEELREKNAKLKAQQKEGDVSKALPSGARQVLSPLGSSG